MSNVRKNKPPVKSIHKPKPAPQAIKTITPSLGKSLRIPSLIIILVTLVVNFNTLFLDYALDDSLLITGNKLTQQGFSAIPKILSSDVFEGYFGKGGIETGGRYRPLSQTLFAIEYGIFGESPFIGHLTNVILYALTCLILLYLLMMLFPPDPGRRFYFSLPFVATLLYSLHPIHVESVANIKSVDEILAMLFSLLAALLIIKSMSGKRIINLVLSFFAFFLALLAKENAITFLAVIPLAVYFKTRSVKNSGVSLIPVAVATILYFVIRSAALGSNQAIPYTNNFLTNPFYGADLIGRIATVLVIALRYLWLLVFPYPLTTDYYPPMIPVAGPGNPLVWLSLLIFGAAAVIAIIKLKKRSVLSFGILYFFLTYSVVSNLLVNLGTPMNDRFLFMPSMGFVLIVAWFLLEKVPALVKWKHTRNVVSGFLILVMLLYSVQTISRNTDWKNDYTLLNHDIKISGKSARCNVMTGKIIYERAQLLPPAQREEYYKRAEQYLKKGTEIFSDYYLAWGLLGIIEMDSLRNNNLQAAHYFIRCLRVMPDLSVALANLSVVGKRMEIAGDLSGAKYAFNNLKNIQPENSEPYLQLAGIFYSTEKIDSAITVLDELLKINPGISDAYRFKGEIYLSKLNDNENAEKCFIKAKELDPKSTTIIDNLGVLAFRKKDYSLALRYFFEALEISKGSAHFYMNIAKTYNAQGDKANAEKYIKLARESEQKGIK